MLPTSPDRDVPRSRRAYWLSLLIIVAVVGCLAFKWPLDARRPYFDSRLCLIMGGFALFAVARKRRDWGPTFLKTMADDRFLSVILPVFAFVAVCKATGSNDVFLDWSKHIFQFQSLLVPLVVVLTFATNLALVSASVTAGAMAPVTYVVCSVSAPKASPVGVITYLLLPIVAGASTALLFITRSSQPLMDTTPPATEAVLSSGMDGAPDVPPAT